MAAPSAQRSARGTLMEVLGRAEQQRLFGLDCGDAVQFEAGTWQPGGEHVRRILIKNVSTRTVKFQYELPTTKFFSMAFPTLMTLSPGMQTAVNLAFRPVQLEEYEDAIGIRVQIIEGGVVAVSGGFRLPVVARIARLAFELPTGLDMGFCPTAERTEQPFVLRNTGEIDLCFDWSLAGAGEDGKPFAVDPPSGRVGVGKAADLLATFAPTRASVFVTNAVCSARPTTDESSSAASTPIAQEMKITAISKFAHLSVSEAEVRFGEVMLGTETTCEKQIELRNRSLVRSTFKIIRCENDCDPVFCISPDYGLIEAESSTTLRIRYSPRSAGAFTCDHFDVVTPAQDHTRITCTGRAVGPNISLWKQDAERNYAQARSLNFGDVQVGRDVSRVLILRNDASTTCACFQFDCMAQGVFSFDHIGGCIPPSQDVNVTVTFRPSQAGNYYRRIFVLQQDGCTLFIDVLGTGFDDRQRPSPFQQGHIDAYRLRASHGLDVLNPDQLESYWQDHGDEMFLQGALRRIKVGKASGCDGEAFSKHADESNILTRSGETTIAAVAACHEYATIGAEGSSPIVVDSLWIDFGSTSVLQLPSKKILRVTNRTHGKVTCSWSVGSTAPAAFQVFPPSLDIDAHGVAEFRVGFEPQRDGAYYYGELEGFVSFKSNRTFRLVNVETFGPPWCIVTRVCGNTFANGAAQFLPKVTLRRGLRSVHFPPCFIGDSVFQTIRIDNGGDTPALYCIADDPSNVFTCSPHAGYISAQSFQLVQIRFTPHKSTKYTQSLQCVINNAHSSPEILELVGIGALPRLRILSDGQAESVDADNDKQLFIKPTAIGLASTRRVVIHNVSRVPLVYRWEVAPTCRRVLDIAPQLGRLNGNEAAEMVVTFQPQEVRKYSGRCTVSVKPISVPLQLRRIPAPVPTLHEATLRVLTQGADGAIAFDPAELSLETILVHSSLRRELQLVNNADCDLTYLLEYSTHIVRNAYQGESISDTPVCLVFSEASGRIPARSQKAISFTFQPSVAAEFEFDITCKTSAVMNSEDLHRQHRGSYLGDFTQMPTCRVHAEASVPTVLVEDIRISNLPTRLGWSQFSCHELNEYLLLPADSELDTSPNEGDVARGTTETCPCFAFPFSPAPLGAPVQVVCLKIRNPGGLIVDFALRLPKEDNVEIEHWAETGAPSAQEVRLDAIIDSQVFSISPRQATLQPKQSIVLTLSYAYTSTSYGGIHDLPILLKVAKGKQLTIELQGRTLNHCEPKLFLSQRVVRLSPVLLGEAPACAVTRDDLKEEETEWCSRAATQQIQVWNHGERAFQLHVGPASFAQNTLDRAPSPVLRCTTSTDVILPKSSAFVNVIFRPIVADPIEARLVLTARSTKDEAIAYKEAALITLVTQGFHPAEVSLEQLHRINLTGGPPTRQLTCVPHQHVRFVDDQISFFHAPMFSQTSQVLVLEHTGEPDTPAVSFSWDLSHVLFAKGFLKVTPIQGMLAPGQQELVRITLQLEGEPIVVDHDIACIVTPHEMPMASDSASTKGGATSNASKHMSVATRSTATQAVAATSSAVSHKTTRTGDANLAEVTPSNGANQVFPLFVHVYAHTLHREVFEKVYPDRVNALAPAIMHESVDDAAVMPSHHIGPSLDPHESHHAIMNVMELLLSDVLNSHDVQEAVDDAMLQPGAFDHDRFSLSPDSQVAGQRMSSDLKHTASIDPPAGILAGVLENTVLNVLQELFHGDMEQALLCVPRKTVFATTSSAIPSE